MSVRVAVVGIACRYPDADSPDDLWHNVLAGRRAFRRIPDERLRLADYWSPDQAEPDRFNARMAAVIEGFSFDRVKFKIPSSTYRSTDLTHWLALDTAAAALADAGFTDGRDVPRTSTGVVVGNTLTGEFSRANVLRLRWPYVRRTVAAALADRGFGDGALAEFLGELEARYKNPFPPPDEDMLAGGLSNTIAGRICNYFDFKGGGYTVDGACASSLLAVITACNALAAGELDVAVAGGVDLSIDPFEIIGFARTGALATSQMRVYDKNSNGLWPGEGCGMVVLARQEDADARGMRTYATIRGWGYASDGKGGLTRPELDGHVLAMRRAYDRTGFDIGSVGYIEGHGTGTAVGDATELRAFATARREAAAHREADRDGSLAAISTVKANIGHTKAAAGIAGLLKATLAVHHQVIPPASGHTQPHEELERAASELQVPSSASLWPLDRPIRAAVSSLGFGGINSHLVLEHPGGPRRTSLDGHTLALTRSRQDCELLLVTADTAGQLRRKLAHLAAFSARLSYAELGDLAATLQGSAADRRLRAATVAAAPDEAQRGFSRLIELLDGGAKTVLDTTWRVFLGEPPATPPSVGYLFPGQGSGGRADGGAIRWRFEQADGLYRNTPLPPGTDAIATAVAQPRIVLSSIAGLRVLAHLGIEATAAAGHSLGELTSLHWGGAIDETRVLRLAADRGRTMAAASRGGGTMASIAAVPEDVAPLLAGEPVVIAGYNGPRQTVISGPVAALDRVSRRATSNGFAATRIAVSHAFHSELVAPAAAALRGCLDGMPFGPLRRRVFSTVTGMHLASDCDLRELLEQQVLKPVLFADALERMATEVDLLIEVGPGQVLSGLAADIAPQIPAVAMETDSPSLAGVLRAAAMAYVLGAPLRHERLFSGRFTRALPLDKEFSFFASPAESARPLVLAAPAREPATAPTDGAGQEGEPATSATGGEEQGIRAAVGGAERGGREDSLTIVRRLAAERADLPLEAVQADSHPLEDLHLSSITVGQIVNRASRELGVAPPAGSSVFASATVSELAQMLDELAGTALPDDALDQQAPVGVAPWAREFAVELVPTPRAAGAVAQDHAAEGRWQLFAPESHPLARPVYDALRAARMGDGVLLCLPDDCDERHVPLMLAAARAALAHAGTSRFVAVQGARGAGGLAKTLHLEAPSVKTSIISIALPARPTAGALTAAVRDIVADVAATRGFSEVIYDGAATRRVPVLRPVPAVWRDAAGTGLSARPGGEPGPRPGGELPLRPGDVLLVTGGGKGITAECALALARETGVAVVLLGRSDPGDDPELAGNLRRMETAGVTYRYVRADVTKNDEVKAAADEIGRALGPVTAILHGAGHNVPCALANLDEAAFRRTLAPKLTGLEAVLAATDPGSLRLLITFGSIIGRAGLRGQADYATANDWLTDLTLRVQRDYPGCRCLALEWSVWSGAGMGERLGVLESLMREGITPITAEDGIAALRRVLANPGAPTQLVVMGRAGELPTITLEQRELPLTRFLEQPRVYYPGIELVADADLSETSDTYLPDHLLDGELLFPAVLGMEAMAQAAVALTAHDSVHALEDVQFLRPITVPPGGSTVIRIAALCRDDGRVDAVIRSSETGFQADHFRATLRCGPVAADGARDTVVAAHLPGAGLPPVALDAQRDVYGHILFQGGRFQRLRGYRHLAATSCVAEISATGRGDWFGAFLPPDLVLSDPGTRDAFMHAIQCCVPDATLLPAAVARIDLRSGDAQQVALHARERSHNGDTYIYDLDVRDHAGHIAERWEGLRLQAVRKTDGSGPWAPALVGPYLERQASALLGTAIGCAVEPDGSETPRGRNERRRQTAVAVSRILREPTAVRYRNDGKPEVDADISVSSSHGGGVTLAVAGAKHVSCDVEQVRERSTGDWRELLGPYFTLAEALCRDKDEGLVVAAARVWGTVECLRKIGRADPGPVTIAQPSGGPGGWALLRSGDARTATFPTQLCGVAEPVMFTILTEGWI